MRIKAYIFLFTLCLILTAPLSSSAIPNIIGPDIKIVDNNIIVNLSIDNIKELESTKTSPKQILQIENFVRSEISFLKKYQKDSQGADEILRFFELMDERDYKQYFKFSPEIMRGFDYYTGNVIEQFDLNPENNRSMFGGGRYDNLVDIYSDKRVPGVGFAMGDVTLMEFLKGWDLLPTLANETRVLVTMFDESTKEKSYQVTQKLRDEGINTEIYLEPKKLDKQFKYADRKEMPFVLVIGPEEIEKRTVQLKDMKTKKQEQLTIDEVIKKFKK